MNRSILYISLAIVFFACSSCEKCIPTILCPYPNPQFYQIEVGDTAAIYIPNVFTPNGDGVNDGFSVYSYNMASLNIQIYDASGRQIYQSNNQTGPYWNGYINGKRPDIGIYAVRVIGTTKAGSPVNMLGTVSILGGQFLGDNSQNIDGNVYIEMQNARFPDQNRNGVYDPNLPPGEYLTISQVHNCH